MDYKNNFCLVFVRNRNNFQIFPFHLIRSSRKVKYINGYGPVNVLLTSEDWNYLEPIRKQLSACSSVLLTPLADLKSFNPETNNDLQSVDTVESVTVDNQCFQINSPTMGKLHREVQEITNLEVPIENTVGLVASDGDEDMCKLLRLGQECTNLEPTPKQITQNQSEQLTIIETLEETTPVENIVGSGASDGNEIVCQLYRTGQECTNPKPLPKHVTESLAEQPDGISIVESIATGGDENMCKLQRTGQEYTNLELTSKEINQNQAKQLIIVETFEQTIPDKSIVGSVVSDGDENVFNLHRAGQECTNPKLPHITESRVEQGTIIGTSKQQQSEQLTIIETLEETIPVESIVGSGASDGDEIVCQLYRTGQECTNPKPLPKHVTESLAEQPDGISIVESIATGGDENMCKLQRTGQEYTNLELTSKEINQNQAKQLIIVETFEQTIPDKSIVESLVSDGDENVFNLHRAGQECTNPKLPHITESRVEQGTIIGTSKQTVPDMESVATAGYTDMCQLSRRGLKRHLPEYAIGDSDTESEPFRSSGSEYVPSDIDIISDSENEKSSAQFNEMSSSNSKQTNENYHKPSYCKRLFSNEKESDKLLSSTLEASSDFEISARSIRSAEPCVSSVADSSKISEPDTDSVEKEDLLEYTDNCVRFTTYEGAHQSVIITDKNTSSLTCKSLCDKKSCIMEKEMIISRNITNEKITLRYATCVGQGVYEGSEYFIGDNNYIAVLKKNSIKSMNEQKKKHFCLFCEKQLIDLTHHLKRQHANESRVQEALNCSNKSIERNRLLRKIRNDGNRKYEEKMGIQLCTPSRTAVKTQNAEYLRCNNCNGNFIFYNYSRHVRKCGGLPANYRHHVTEARLEQMTLNKANQLNDLLITDLLKPLRYDDERLLIETDVALQAYAAYYAVSSKITYNKSKNVRAQLRLLAKLLLRIQCIDPLVPGYPDILTLQKYDLLLLGVMSLVGYKVSTSTFKKSYTPLVLRSCLINLARALKFYYHKTSKGTPEEMKELDLFLENFGSKYTQDVTKAAYQANANLKVLKRSPLPTNEDIAVFASYVEKQAEEAYTALSSAPFTYKNYLKLGKSVLIMLLILNRRRIGETSKITLQCYNQKERVTPEIEKTLNIMEKQLAKHLRVVKLVGKRLRELTILISEKHERYLDLFISLRQEAGVDSNNIYLFASPNSLKFIDASSTLRKFAIRCGAKEPHKLRATLFRKQVATMAQMMHLSDNEIQQLADFMGHTVDVHKEHYRKNCNYQQIVVLSRLFMALEAGDIDRFKNKTFSDVEIMLQRNEDFPWLEDESQSINEQANSDEIDTEAQDLIEEIGSNFVAENLGTVTEEEINLEMLPSTSGHCVDNPSKQTPSPRSHAIKAVMGSSQKSPFKKKRPFTAEELTILEKYLGLFIQQGKYPPQPKRLYQKILNENRDIFHSKRTTQTIHSYVQNQIRKRKSLVEKK